MAYKTGYFRLYPKDSTEPKFGWILEYDSPESAGVAYGEGLTVTSAQVRPGDLFDTPAKAKAAATAYAKQRAAADKKAAKTAPAGSDDTDAEGQGEGEPV